MVTGLWVRTKSIGWPLVSMGVMTMKMISSTNMTSTMGVTLMSATGGGAFCNFISNSFLGRGYGRDRIPVHTLSPEPIQLADSPIYLETVRCVRFKKSGPDPNIV